jgi:dTDP-4-amino-4,6-dideoxygalactose transaminase
LTILAITELQAAIGLVQLGRLDAITACRRRIASCYDEAIPAGRFERPRTLEGAAHVYYQYTLRLPAARAGGRVERARDGMIAALAAAGITAGVYYPVPLHLQPALRNGVTPSLPRAERAPADMFSIPVHPALSDGDVERVAEAVARL